METIDLTEDVAVEANVAVVEAEAPTQDAPVVEEAVRRRGTC